MDGFLEVVKAEYIEDYTVKLYFNNGECRLADLYSSLKGPVFEPLKDTDYFKCFCIKFNTIEWENGADFAPEYLYEISTPLQADPMPYPEDICPPLKVAEP